MTLLKAGANSTKRDSDGLLAIDLAPDIEVRPQHEQLNGIVDMMANELATGSPVHPAHGGE